MAGRALTVAMPATEKSGKLTQTQVLDFTSLLQRSDFGGLSRKSSILTSESQLYLFISAYFLFSI